MPGTGTVGQYGKSKNKTDYWDSSGWNYGPFTPRPNLTDYAPNPSGLPSSTTKPKTYYDWNGAYDSGSDPEFNFKGSYGDANMPTYRMPNISDAPTSTGSEYRVRSAPSYSASYRELPTYTAPKWDEGAVTSLTQQLAAPSLRRLRNEVKSVSGANYENPNVKKMTLREALAGYGQGVSDVMGAATSSAASLYGQRYAAESANARAAYESEASKAKEYNAYTKDVADRNYQGSFAKWQTENAANEMEYKNRTAGDLAAWEARNAAEQRAAEAEYGGKMEAWKTGRDREFDIAKLKYMTEQEKRSKERSWRLEQQALEEAWARWKRQQEERLANPQWGGGPS